MKRHLLELLQTTVAALQKDNTLPIEGAPAVQLERTRDTQHGDFSSNIAMLFAKVARRKPREVAELIMARLPQISDKIAKVEIAGPGFINFYLTPKAYRDVVGDILEAGEAYGYSSVGDGQHVMVEFVSANPNGPLHVGHGRGAAYGAVVADLLAAVGFKVHREYYINDAGRQMDILCASVWLRYLELGCETFTFPRNGYKGDYVYDIAAGLRRTYDAKFQHPAAVVFKDQPLDEQDDGSGDKDAHVDGLIARAKQLLGKDGYRIVFDAGLNAMLADIRGDLEEFGVVYENWFSERTLFESGAVKKAITRLRERNYVYEKDGALWFRSMDFGDEKDRVLVRENGQETYFASDIAYHAEKLERGFARVIDVWGADHHGYVPRIKAAMQALGDDPSKLDVLLVQFAILYRGGQKAQMSTRAGQFVTLRELRKEVGNDAARFFYVMRKSEQHLDFDLDLAKSQSADNPVYYIQYAHARVCSVLRQLAEKGGSYDQAHGLQNLHLLTEEHEQALLRSLGRFPEVVETAALQHEPHQLAHYLRDTANDFHAYYNSHQFLVDDAALRNARLSLTLAAQRVVSNGLRLLGVSAPEVM